MHAVSALLGALFKLAMFLALIATVLRVLYVDDYVMPHNGMAPTLVVGDHLLVWRRAQVDMGNVAVCTHPTRPNDTVIGRAVAFGGHTVSTETPNALLVDDDRASVDFLGELRFFDVTRQKLFMMRLGATDYRRKHRHEFFVEQGSDFHLAPHPVERGIYLLGDNRTDGWNDSREFGEVERTGCKGEAFLRLTISPKRQDDLVRGRLAWLY